MPERQPAPARRRLLAGAAVALAVAGVAAIAVGATSGPDLPSAPAVGAPAVATPSAADGSGTPAPTTAPTTSTSAGTSGAAAPAPTTSSPAEEPAALPRSRPVRLRIPALDVDTTNLVQVGLQPDGRIAVPVGPEPVAWYTGGPAPGQRGPAVLLAHVTWNGARGTFFHLGELQPGQRVSVTRADGRTVTFMVYRVATYPKDSFPTATVYGNTDGPELRLITCAGDYRPGTKEPYPDNVVVFARAA